MEPNSSSTDDCYFYFYSTCTKGDSCPFRHCEAALGTEVVCGAWLESKCVRQACPYRHMQCNKNRATIPCYWESQPGGCRKPHCVFLHRKPKPDLDGKELNENVILPVVLENSTIPSPLGKSNSNDDLSEEFSPQLASRLIEPVVVRFDEESDSEGCAGTPVKMPLVERHCIPIKKEADVVPRRRKIISLKKTTEKQDSENKELNFRIKSLDEIKKEKADKLNSEKSSFDNDSSSIKISSCMDNNLEEGEAEKPSLVKRIRREPAKQKLSIQEKDVMEHNIDQQSVSKLRQLGLERIKLKPSDLLKMVPNDRKERDRKPNNEDSFDRLQHQSPVKRRITLKPTGSSDLSNIQVKTLEEIREEKRLKMLKTEKVELACDIRTEDSQTVASIDDSTKEEERISEKRTLDSVSEQPETVTVKRPRLAYVRPLAAEQLQPNITEQCLPSVAVQSQTVTQLSVEPINKPDLVVKHSSGCLISPVSTEGKTQAHQPSVCDQEHDKANNGIDSLQHSNVAPFVTSTYLVPLKATESPLSELDSGVISVSSVPLNSKDTVNSNSVLEKRISVEEDMALLLEEGEDPCLDDDLDMRDDDDVLRELDEAINNS